MIWKEINYFWPFGVPGEFPKGFSNAATCIQISAELASIANIANYNYKYTYKAMYKYSELYVVIEHFVWQHVAMYGYVQPQEKYVCLKNYIYI